MADEPRRKRKWDAQDDDDNSTKKTIFDSSGASTEVESDAIGHAAVAAAIAAAKINARLAAQGAVPTSERTESTTVSTPEEGSSFSIVKESKERDEFVVDIDINDVKHRYVLTKGSVQTQLQRDSGADITTRGKYYPDRAMATDKDPPLYLHVTATTQDILDQAVAKINELIDEAQNPAPQPPQHQSFRQQPGVSAGGPPRYQSLTARVAIGIESERAFNVRAKIVGPGGQYVKHVQNETRTRVQLKGHGSGYLENDTGRESDEPLYINIIGNNQEDVDNAERLCRDLVETVKAEYERMKSRPPPPHESYGHSRQYGSGRSSYYESGRPRFQGGQHYQQSPHHHHHSYSHQYEAAHPPPPGTQGTGQVTAPVNPPLPPGPPPPAPPALPTLASSGESSAPISALRSSQPADALALEVPPSDSTTAGYSYDQYEAYNQYYYQQQYYQQYGQYYQYAAVAASPSDMTASAVHVSSDPALTYYGYAHMQHTVPPPPSSNADPPSSASSPSEIATHITPGNTSESFRNDDNHATTPPSSN
ncbi:MAG: hypothetical protein BYD32DRAFT_464241 [Podila humilis]|nr:MAG: hypothetical protein BYD32DRAFT_464241 [Podila humilis]